VIAAATLGLATGCGGEGGVSFSRDVQPIFDGKCTTCHPVSYPQLDLRAGRSYAQLVRVPAQTNLAFQRVLPGRPELSFLLTHPPDPALVDLMSDSDREVITRWIAEGAKDN
jgi:hypothetical protein